MTISGSMSVRAVVSLPETAPVAHQVFTGDTGNRKAREGVVVHVPAGLVASVPSFTDAAESARVPV